MSDYVSRQISMLREAADSLDSGAAKRAKRPDVMVSNLTFALGCLLEGRYCYINDNIRLLKNLTYALSVARDQPRLCELHMRAAARELNIVADELEIRNV